MSNLKGIVNLAEREMGVIVSNGRFKSRDEIDTVYKLIDLIKDAYCIWKYEDEGYSTRGRYSRNDEYVSKLHDLMEHAPDDATRQSIQRMIDSM